MKQLLPLGLLVVLCVLGGARSSPAEEFFAEPDPVMQAELDAIRESRDDLELLRRVRDLKARAGDGEGEALVEQVSLFASGLDGEEGLYALLILHRLEINPSVVIRVLAPCVDSKNENLREFAREWFAGFGKAPEDPIDDYASYLGGRMLRGQEVPAGFADYLFAQSPGRALLAFNRGSRVLDTTAQLAEMRAIQGPPALEGDAKQDAERPPDIARNLPDREARRRRAEARDEVVLAEHLVSDALWFKQRRFNDRFQRALPGAQQQLAKLAKSGAWWARRYVAEIMKRHPEFRSPDLVDELSRDNDPRVSEPSRQLTE